MCLGKENKKVHFEFECIHVCTIKQNRMCIEAEWIEVNLRRKECNLNKKSHIQFCLLPFIGFYTFEMHILRIHATFNGRLKCHMRAWSYYTYTVHTLKKIVIAWYGMWLPIIQMPLLFSCFLFRHFMSQINGQTLHYLNLNANFFWVRDFSYFAFWYLRSFRVFGVIIAMAWHDKCQLLPSIK